MPRTGPSPLPRQRLSKRVKLVERLNQLIEFNYSYQVSEDLWYSGRSAHHEQILTLDLSLNVTRPWCEYQGAIMQLTVDADVKRFHVHASPSGYGDMQTMTTVINPDVRSAQELTSDEFTVSDDVLQLEVRLWQTRFCPPAVRAEAYKVNVYEPGDFFEPHKDTPAGGLVGTLLLGLGDRATAGS